MQRAGSIDPNPLEIYSTVGNYFGIWLGGRRAGSRGEDTSSRVPVPTSPGWFRRELDLDFANSGPRGLLRSSRQYRRSGDFADAGRLGGRQALAIVKSAVTSLERQFPSLKGEVIEYMDAQNLIDAVLLAYCNKEIGRDAEAARISDALFASDLISGDALIARPGLKLVRIGLHSVADDRDAALSELALIDPNNSPVAISSLSLPVDDLPIFASLANEDAFKKFAVQSNATASHSRRGCSRAVKLPRKSSSR